MNKAIHVCVQEPTRLFGGLGVAVLNLSQAQASAGWEVVWLSLRSKGRSASEVLAIPGGYLTVVRIEVADSSAIDTYNDGSDLERFTRREAFCRGVLEEIHLRYACDWTVFLHGLYFEPLLAAGLSEYASVSAYYLLETDGLQVLNDLGHPRYSQIRALEVLSLIASKRVQAISGGTWRKMADRIALLRDPAIAAEVRLLAKAWDIEVPADPSQAHAQFAANSRIIPLGISDEFYCPPTRPTQPGRVAAWGRVAPEKGFEHFLQVAGRMPERAFFLWGKLPLRQTARQAYLRGLEELAAAKSNTVLDFREWVPSTEVVQKVDEAEIIVVPSLYEPFGLVVVEALARGKPVIATDTDGPRDIFGGTRLGRYDIGYLISCEPAEISNGIQRSLLDFYSLTAAERLAMSEAARLRALDYSSNRMLHSLSEWMNSPLQ